MARTSRSAARVPPGRIRLPAAERREIILLAATDVFAEMGYRASKVADIAARVGVTEPVIFQNFGSKAALFAAVIDRAAAAVRASLDGLADHGSPSALLAHALNQERQWPGHAETGREGRRTNDAHTGAAYAVLFADAAAMTAEPELTESLRNAVRAVAGHLADLIRHAQAHGGVRESIEPEAAAWLVLSVLAARRMRSQTMPDRLEPDIMALTLGALTV